MTPEEIKAEVRAYASQILGGRTAIEPEDCFTARSELNATGARLPAGTTIIRVWGDSKESCGYLAAATADPTDPAPLRPRSRPSLLAE